MTSPAFMRISSTFQIDSKGFFGTGVASANAIYLVITKSRNDVAGAMGGAMGGLVGSLVMSAVTELMGKKGPNVQMCTVNDLPRVVRTHAEWPVKGKRDGDLQVLVIPKGQVQSIEHPGFSNLLKFSVGDKPIKIEYLLFRGSKVRDYLAKTGWPLVWKGKPVKG